MSGEGDEIDSDIDAPVPEEEEVDEPLLDYSEIDEELDRVRARSCLLYTSDAADE